MVPLRGAIRKRFRAKRYGGVRRLRGPSFPFHERCRFSGKRKGGEMSANEEPAATNSVRMAISNEMVRLYKEQFGRGPTETRTHWAGDDMLVVRLDDTLTPAE